MSHISVTMSDGAVYDAPIIEQDQFQQYYRVLYDWERSDWTGELTRPNLPMVFTLGKKENTNDSYIQLLPKEWQLFLWEITCRTVFGCLSDGLSQVEYNWLAGKMCESVLHHKRAFTNNYNGLDVESNKADYIRKIRLTQPLPKYDKIRVCGGNSLTGIITTNLNGEHLLQVDCFDGKISPPSPSTIDVDSDPRIFFATICRQAADKSYISGRFPQYIPNQIPPGMDPGRVLRTDVPIAIISSNPIYYKIENLKAYKSAKKLNPYT